MNLPLFGLYWNVLRAREIPKEWLAEERKLLIAGVSAWFIGGFLYYAILLSAVAFGFSSAQPTGTLWFLRTFEGIGILNILRIIAMQIILGIVISTLVWRFNQVKLSYLQAVSLTGWLFGLSALLSSLLAILANLVWQIPFIGSVLGYIFGLPLGFFFLIAIYLYIVLTSFSLQQHVSARKS